MLDTQLLSHWTRERAVRLADSDRELGSILHAYLDVLARRPPSLRLVAGADEAAERAGAMPVVARA